jgi:hypothetical protein
MPNQTHTPGPCICKPWNDVLCPTHERWIAHAPAMLQLVRLIAHGAEQPFDHPDKRALCKSAAEARAILREVDQTGD